MELSENEMWSLAIPLILMLIAYVYAGIDYKKHKNYNRIFTKSVVPILIILWTVWSGIAHIFMGKAVSKSIGWGVKSGFQAEVGMFQIAISGLSIYYLTKHNIKALVGITMIWVVFMIQASLLHLKEIVFDRNYSFNTIRPTITGIINTVFILFIISKVDVEKWE